MHSGTAFRSFLGIFGALLLAACGGGDGGSAAGGGGTGGGLTPPPVIANATLPSAMTGANYPGFTFTVASGGAAPFTWSATGTLPDGMSIGTDGQLFGIPVSSGTFSIPVSVTDSSIPALTASKSFQIVVNDSPLVINTGSAPPEGTVTYLYPGMQLTASGGSLPLIWSSTGALPVGLTLDANGLLSGTPTSAGVFSFTARVTDSASTPESATQAITVVVNNPAPPAVNAAAAPPVGTVGAGYAFNFTANGGYLPLQWALTDGSLPGGLAVGADGLLSGTPTSAGSFSFTVTVTDSGVTPATAAAAFTVVIVNPPPPTINNRSLPTGTVGTAYPAILFSAIDGLAPLVWSETGALPGLGLSLDGALSGTPSSAGRFPIEVNVKDALNQAALPAPFTVRVSLARPAAGFIPTGSMTTPRLGHTATLLLNGQVLVAGGSDASAELYDPASGTFTATGSMTVARHGHTATLLANAALPDYGKVLIVAGEPTGISAELYDPVTGTFTATGSAAGMLIGPTATLLNTGKVLFIGGGSTATVAAQLYDPLSATFTATGDLKFARTGSPGSTATLLLDGRVLVAAGGTNAAELYDPASGTFTATSSMNVVRASAMATRLQDGSVLIVGRDLTAELYDPITGTFALVGEPLSYVDGATASLRKDGTVLVAGGSSWKTFYGTCTLATACSSGSRYQRASVRVSTALAQSFAPESQGFTATGSLNAARNGHTATVLADDSTVLITGGTQYSASPSYHPTSAQHTVLSSAELYK